MNQYDRVELIAWIGEDELGSGQVGIKQALVPAGFIPLAAIGEHLDRLQKVKPQLEQQAQRFGKKIRLCRFLFAEVLDETQAGS